MTFRIYIVFIFLSVWSVSGISQQIALEELIHEAETKYWDVPAHSIRIAEYILTQNEKVEVASKANLILAKSYLSQEKTFDAIRALFPGYSQAEETNNYFLQAETKLLSYEVLQQLSLNTISDEVRQQLETLKKNSELATYIENQLVLIDAELALEQEEFDVAVKLFDSLDSDFISSDPIRKIRFQMAQARLHFKRFDYKKTEKILNELPPDLPKYFQVIKLNLSAELFLKSNDFNRAISTWNEAKETANLLPNKELANRSLEGLIQVYLINEDSKKYFDYQQEFGVLTSDLVTDRVRAVNFAYNQFENLHQESATKEIIFARKKVFFLSGILLIFITVLLGINYYYNLRIREYHLLKKLVSPAPLPVVIKKESSEKNLVSEETEKQLLEALKIFESGTEFTRSDMSIAYLAAHLNTNIKYLSDVINRHKGKNFNGYINELRINYIIDKLKSDPIYLNYKISYLAEESGFSSHSSFTTVFKSVTGISPTKFLGFLQKEGIHEN